MVFCILIKVVNQNQEATFSLLLRKKNKNTQIYKFLYSSGWLLSDGIWFWVKSFFCINRNDLQYQKR